MAHLLASIADALEGVDPLAFLYLAGCLVFLWVIWKVVADDRDLRGTTSGDTHEPPGETRRAA